MPTGIYNHKPHSEDTKQKMKNSWNYDKHITNERNNKISKSMMGEQHHKYKGNKANQNVIHRWIEKRKPRPKICEECKEERRLNLASLTNHIYTRNIEDYKWLCYSCHKKMDMQCSQCSRKGVKLHLVCEECINWKHKFIRLLKEEFDNCRDKTDVWEDEERWNKFEKMFKKKIKELVGEKLC